MHHPAGPRGARRSGPQAPLDAPRSRSTNRRVDRVDRIAIADAPGPSPTEPAGAGRWRDGQRSQRVRSNPGDDGDGAATKSVPGSPLPIGPSAPIALHSDRDSGRLAPIARTKPDGMHRPVHAAGRDAQRAVTIRPRSANLRTQKPGAAPREYADASSRTTRGGAGRDDADASSRGAAGSEEERTTMAYTVTVTPGAVTVPSIPDPAHAGRSRAPDQPDSCPDRTGPIHARISRAHRARARASGAARACRGAPDTDRRDADRRDSHRSGPSGTGSAP